MEIAIIIEDFDSEYTIQEKVMNVIRQNINVNTYPRKKYIAEIKIIEVQR
jgi:hypothetical protein